MDIYERIRKFNQIFGLTTSDIKHPDKVQITARLVVFKSILQQELNEVDDILKSMRAPTYNALDAFTDIADWLVDMQVYCASEMLRYGIPVLPVMHIVMDCQDSKLVDGKPLVVDGKVQKGPNYQPPEADIRHFLNFIGVPQAWKE